VKKISQEHLPELVFAGNEPKSRKQIHKWQKDGLIKKIAPRIYTTNFEEKPSEIIARKILHVLGALYPGSVLSHRSAFEFKPTRAGNIFVTHGYTKKIKLPGVTIHFQKGKSPIEGDNKFVGELFVSQKERALLENLQISKKPGPQSKTLTIPEIEERLEEIITVHGEAGLNDIRDKARKIARQLNMSREFDKLNKMISSILSTGDVRKLESPAARARALGVPYDSARIDLFETVFRELANREFKNRPDKNVSLRSFRNFAFFESYFSNYIEGTEFEVAEAREIIETGKPIQARHDDSRDILGTYQLVSNKRTMGTLADTAEDLIKILLARHKTLLSARTTKHPGQFKEKNNRAGSSFFVDYKLVRGTLIKGFEIHQALKSPFARAAFMMFMVSEIHPFEDGNGRIARVMMNAELVAAKESKIIIPNVFRIDYLGALKKLTKQGNPDSYVRMLSRAHEFSANVFGEDIDDVQNYLERCNAFETDEDKILRIEER
jgi:fido (protein-threonine AMPylation protein)